MRELCILAGFFVTVMVGTGLVGYAVLFGRQTADSESPLMETPAGLRPSPTSM